MAQRSYTEDCRPGDTLVVVHEFAARSPDELSLRRGDRIELIERDDDFSDGWFLGKNAETGGNGLFPEIYTRPAPKPTPIPTMLSRKSSQASSRNERSSTTNKPATIDSPTSQPKATDHMLSSLRPSASAELLNAAAFLAGTDLGRKPSTKTVPRSISMTLNGDIPAEDDIVASLVMHETLSVIDEHITDMGTPRHTAVNKDSRANDSGSEYSSFHRLSYVNGEETDEEEEQEWHTEEEVKTWSSARVGEYLESMGVEKRHCLVFQDQDIDGEALLGVDRNFIFMQEFDLGPMGPRLRTWMKINALQIEVKNAKEAAMHAHQAHQLDGHDEFPGVHGEAQRNRSASTSAVLPRIPTYRESIGARSNSNRSHVPRAASSAGRSMSSSLEGSYSTTQHTAAASPHGHASRPSAASVRSMNHNRRHSSIDYDQSPILPHAQPPSSYKKAPSFDRGWTMDNAPKSAQELRRPISSHHGHSNSTNGTAFDIGEAGMVNSADLDRGYFSGGEIDNRKNPNVLRKKDSPNHSRNTSYNGGTVKRASYTRRHSRMTSDPSTPALTSPAAKHYYGNSIKGDRNSVSFDLAQPLKPTADMKPAVTKLSYDSPSIDVVTNSPAVGSSETSSTGRASPSPATHSHARAFFSKKVHARGLRAISDAITGGEKATVSEQSPYKDSSVQLPRTGSTTPLESTAKSFDADKPDMKKRSTDGSITTKDSARRKAKKHGTSAYTKGRQQITPQQALENCDYSGWMKKKSSSLMTTWKTRLFVLRGRRLAYYYTEDDKEEKGLIDISSHRVLPANNERMTGLHVALTRAASSPTSPQNATIQTTAFTESAQAEEDHMAGMFIFKLVPPRAGLQKGVQFTKPIVHYFAVDSLAVGRLWMAALMKATIDRDEALPITTTYQQKTISLEKARATRQRPPNLMGDEDAETGSADNERKSDYSKESIQDSVIVEEDEKGLGISDVKYAGEIIAYVDHGDETRAQPAEKMESEPAAVAT